ncbi:MAG: twin-arginine translocation signal domain-containing protein, partial [Coriobacteriia bacterium]|nr:twin-arginine translocation signal domain-containing protein [Coriobacteriia bacterium]
MKKQENITREPVVDGVAASGTSNASTASTASNASSASSGSSGSDASNPESGLSRRTFVKGASVLGALAALGGGVGLFTRAATTQEALAAEDDFEVRHAFCQMCGPARVHCSTHCYLKEGRWLHVEGNPLAGNNASPGSKTLCGKGQSAMQVLYSPSRILYPSKRVGNKGEGKFERITWD